MSYEDENFTASAPEAAGALMPIEQRISEKSIRKVFAQHKDFIIIGLTGRNGSGLKDVAGILSSEFADLKLCGENDNKKSAEDDDNRRRKIIYNFAQQNWVPFDVIGVRDVILSFVFEQPPSIIQRTLAVGDDEQLECDRLEKAFAKTIEDLDSRVEGILVCDGLGSDDYSEICAEVVSDLRNDLREAAGTRASVGVLDMLHAENENFLKIVSRNNESVIDATLEAIADMEPGANANEIVRRADRKKHIRAFIYVKHILPAISEAVRSCFGPGDYTVLFQRIGNRIRFTGRADKREVAMEEIDCENNIFATAKRINEFIKTYRHPVGDDSSANVRIVIDSIKNPYEAEFLRSRYSAFYMMAVTQDDSDRIAALGEKKVDRKVIDLIDWNERPREACNVYNKYKKAINEYMRHIKADINDYLNSKKAAAGDADNEDYDDLAVFAKGLSERYEGWLDRKFTDSQIAMCKSVEEDAVRSFCYRNKVYGPFLQDAEACIQSSDIFVRNDADDREHKNMKLAIVRAVSLIMHPGIVSPTPVERCMQIAMDAMVNSGCISRQVGAVVTDGDFNILSIGWNEVPYGQSPCNVRSLLDLANDRDEHAFSDYELNDPEFREEFIGKYDLPTDEEFRKKCEGLPAAYCFKNAYCDDVLKERNQVHTRSMHAEERAFINCPDKWKAKGGYLFTTSSSCELCAKKANEYQIKEIYYVEPYPGISQMHICDSGDDRARHVLFQGILGRAYMQLFTPVMPLKDELAMRGFYKNCDKWREGAA